jgi:hypothetical protein
VSAHLRRNESLHAPYPDRSFLLEKKSAPENYNLFTPLLPSATVGTVETRSLIEPLRKLVARVKGHYLQAFAVDVDFGERLVEVKGREKDDEPFYVRKSPRCPTLFLGTRGT